jgi:hypothetical protein
MAASDEKDRYGYMLRDVKKHARTCGQRKGTTSNLVSPASVKHRLGGFI